MALDYRLNSEVNPYRRQWNVPYALNLPSVPLKFSSSTLSSFVPRIDNPSNPANISPPYSPHTSYGREQKLCQPLFEHSLLFKLSLDRDSISSCHSSDLLQWVQPNSLWAKITHWSISLVHLSITSYNNTLPSPPCFVERNQKEYSVQDSIWTDPLPCYSLSLTLSLEFYSDNSEWLFRRTTLQMIFWYARSLWRRVPWGW